MPSFSVNGVQGVGLNALKARQPALQALGGHPWSTARPLIRPERSGTVPVRSARGLSNGASSSKPRLAEPHLRAYALGSYVGVCNAGIGLPAVGITAMLRESGYAQRFVSRGRNRVTHSELTHRCTAPEQRPEPDPCVSIWLLSKNGRTRACLTAAGSGPARAACWLEPARRRRLERAPGSWPWSPSRSPRPRRGCASWPPRD